MHILKKISRLIKKEYLQIIFIIDVILKYLFYKIQQTTKLTLLNIDIKKLWHVFVVIVID